MACKCSLVDTSLHAIVSLHLVLCEILFETYQGILATLLCLQKPCNLVHCYWVVDCLVVLLTVVIVVVVVVVVVVVLVLFCVTVLQEVFLFILVFGCLKDKLDIE